MIRNKNVLVVAAHADDMEFMAAGTVARFIDEMGYDVYQYILTDNSKGSYRLSTSELIAQSAREAREAGKALGLKDIRFGEYEDGELNQENPNELRGKIMGYIREVKADIVMSWDPFAPYEEHPDHRAVGMATLEAASFSGNAKFHPEHSAKPYPVLEAYWFAKHPREAMMYVNIMATFEKKVQALLMHASQMELIVDNLKQEAAVVGLDVSVLHDERKSEHDRIIRSALHTYFTAIGHKAGMPIAEQFRYQQMGHLEAVLSEPYITPDFS